MRKRAFSLRKFSIKNDDFIRIYREQAGATIMTPKWIEIMQWKSSINQKTNA
jgi:hypothetical protein